MLAHAPAPSPPRVVRAATIGWAKLNTADSPGREIQLRFGKVNSRPLNNTAVTALLQDFLLSGRDPLRTPLYVLVQKEWLEPGSYSTDPPTSWSALPELRFTDAAFGVVINILSGNHRTDACKRLRDQLEGDLAVAEAELAKLPAESHTEERSRYEKLISLLKNQTVECVKWGMHLLDASMCQNPFSKLASVLLMSRCRSCKLSRPDVLFTQHQEPHLRSYRGGRTRPDRRTHAGAR